MNCILCKRLASHHEIPQIRRCVQCNLYLCISCGQDCREVPCPDHPSCWSKHIDGSPEVIQILHQPVNPTAEQFIKAITCSGMSDAAIKELHAHDKLARWFSVKKGRDADEKPDLWLYDRFRRLCDPYATGNRATGNHYPSIVSFIGNTSAGKSTVVRAMLLLGLAEQLTSSISDTPAREKVLFDLIQAVLSHPEEHDLPVSQGGLDPTTFGVHLYRNNIATGPEPSAYPQYPLLFADCEGFTAGFAPTNAERDAPDTDDPDEQVETMNITADDYGTDKAGIDLFYARFLYAVSDVVVFVTPNPKSKGDDIPRILEWAAGAMLKTFNQPSGKTLIVVCNKYTPEESDRTPQRLKEKFLLAQEPGLWKKPGIIATFVERFNATTTLRRMIRDNNDLYDELFRSIHFCYVPDKDHVDVHGQPEKLLEHFQQLQHVLDRSVAEERDIRAQSLIRYNVAELSHFLSRTFQHFTVSSAPLDFYKATCRDNHTPTNLREHIANFLRLAFDRKNMVHNGQVESMVESVIALSLLILARRQDSATFTPEVKFAQDLGKYWDAGLNLYQRLHEQCAYVFTTPQGAHVPCACQGRGAKHQFHIPTPPGPGQKKYNLYPIAGDFAPGHLWNKEAWRKRIQDRFCQFYRRVYLSPASHDRYQQHLPPPQQRRPHHLVDSSVLNLRRELTSETKPLFSHLFSTKTCLSCLLSSPDHVLSCGHAYCPRCIQELSTHSQWKECAFDIHACVLCDCQDPSHNNQTIQFKPRCAGVRILTLDGGGVRGIVELGLVKALEDEIKLTNVRLAEMFDLIIGTSTGGIVALALTFPGKLVTKDKTGDSKSQYDKLRRRSSGIDTRMEDMISFFESVSERTFKHSRAWIRGLSRALMIFRRVESVYSEEPLQAGLQEYFGEETQLFAPAVSGKMTTLSSGIRVAVTSARDDGKTLVVIGNYNRPLTTSAAITISEGGNSGFEREDDLSKDFKIWEAAIATSAAPFYLPPFKKKKTGDDYVDGAVNENCPARVGMDEMGKIWAGVGDGNEKADVHLDALVSLGTGNQGPKPDKTPTALKFRGFAVLKEMIRGQMDTQKIWEGVVSRADKLQKGRLFRLNPAIEPPYVELYQCEEVPRLLSETGGWAKAGGAGQDEIRNVARVLMAGMFFYEVPDAYSPPSNLSQQAVGTHEKLLRGSIRCRLRHQSPAVKELLGKVKGFYHTELTADEAAEEEKSLGAASRQWRTLTDMTSGSVNLRDMVRVRERNPDGSGIEQFRLDFELRVRERAALQVIAVEFQGDDDSDARSISEQESERCKGKRFSISGFPVTLAVLSARGQMIWLQ
ncbi:putative patatin-like phospholipase [Triangularia setosa]|uniref:Patatin-like phospholipase n=1 Tax=Triangularia setosa TaxID=2587417 RepID=A0AAN6WB73_9PEZI|nr:putative patatin-like phospholipase [Podospora setosa]